MLLLVGLGNPGPKYQGNRHNVGFMAVDAIVHRHSFGPWRARFEGLVSEGTIDDVKVLALKPQTFMNESGRAVGQAKRFYKVDGKDLVVLYDELDLKPFKVRVKVGGGAAGHNGIRSIDAHVGPEYRRVRIGIGHPGDKNLVLHHALGDFFKEEKPELEKTLAAIVEASPLLARGDDNAFMTKVALLTQPPPPPKPPKPPAVKKED